MMEGVSVRAIARLTDVDKNTILSLMNTVAQKCRRVFDVHVQKMRPR